MTSAKQKTSEAVVDARLIIIATALTVLMVVSVWRVAMTIIRKTTKIIDIREYDVDDLIIFVNKDVALGLTN